MANVLIRDIEEDLLKKLKMRAKENGRSLQAELKLLFITSVGSERLSDIETAVTIKNGLRGHNFSDSAEALHEDRSR